MATKKKASKKVAKKNKDGLNDPQRLVAASVKISILGTLAAYEPITIKDVEIALMAVLCGLQEIEGYNG